MIYNRIPKCGSTTIQEYIDKTVKVSKGKVGHWSADREFWYKEYDLDVEMRKKMYAQVKRYKDRVGDSGTLVVDGHWWWHKMEKRFKKSSIGYFQMVRECEDRVGSAITYALFNSLAAREANSKHRKNDYLSYALNTTVVGGDVRPCLNSLDCLNNSVISRQMYDGFMAKFFCGKNCEKENTLLDGALSRIHNAENGYDAIGVMEYMQDSLLMFQCAFPTVFHNSASSYGRRPIRDRVSKKVKEPDALTQFEHNACHPTDSTLYDETKRIFLERTQFIKQNWGMCCRGYI